MTPSQWHDDGRNRDAGHDEMQIAVFDYLQNKYPLLKDSVGFEVPIIARGQIIAWADIAMILPNFVVLWEIKPRIYSVGAVVRQCIALAHTARCMHQDVRVVPVVQSDDPKLSALQHVFDAKTWDGERLS